MRLVEAFNKVKKRALRRYLLRNSVLSLQRVISLRRLAAVKRTALPVRLVAAFNKAEIKSIAKEKALNSLRTVAVHNQPAAASCCRVLLDCCCKTYP